MKHFETKFASKDFKVNFLNLKKVKKNFLMKNRFFKKMIRNFYLSNFLNCFKQKLDFSFNISSVRHRVITSKNFSDELHVKNLSRNLYFGFIFNLILL